MTDATPNPKRIVVYGCTGSGKTTAAKEIGRRLGLPVFDGDALSWCPGWEGVPPQEKATAFSEIARRPEWVLDDDGPDGMMFATADLLILLDYPRWLSFRRLLKRSVVRVLGHTEICNGNYETWHRLISRDSQLLWHTRTWQPKHELIRELAAQNRDRVLLFTKPTDLAAWLRSLPQTTSPRIPRELA